MHSSMYSFRFPLTVLLLGTLTASTAEAAAQTVLKVLTDLLDKQEQEETDPVHLNKIRDAKIMLAKNHEQMLPLFEEYLSSMKDKYGHLDLSTSHITHTIEKYCTRGYAQFPHDVQTRYSRFANKMEKNLEHVCDALHMPFNVKS